MHCTADSIQCDCKCSQWTKVQHFLHSAGNRERWLVKLHFCRSPHSRSLPISSAPNIVVSPPPHTQPRGPHRQITMPAPDHWVFYRPDALPATQSTEGQYNLLLATGQRCSAVRHVSQTQCYHIFAYRLIGTMERDTLLHMTLNEFHPLSLTTTTFYTMSWSMD